MSVLAFSGAKGAYGTEAIKAVLSKIFQNLKLDKNNDGSISNAELVEAAFNVLPSFLNSQLLSEATDIDKPELAELLDWAGKHFPELAAFPDAVENVVSRVLQFGEASVNLWVSVEMLNHEKSLPPTVVEATNATAPVVVEKKMRFRLLTWAKRLLKKTKSK